MGPTTRAAVPAIFSRLSRLLVVLALLVSIGGHWALLQSVAWTRMIIKRTQEASFAGAVKDTFAGDHPCALCRRIVDGQQKEQQPEKSPLSVKVDLLCERRLIAIAPPFEALNFPSSPTEGTPRAERPPVPPPRVA